MQQSVKDIARRLREIGVPDSAIERHCEQLRQIRGSNGLPRVKLVYDPHTGEYTRYRNRQRRPPGRHYVRT